MYLKCWMKWKPNTFFLGRSFSLQSFSSWLCSSSSSFSFWVSCSIRRWHFSFWWQKETNQMFQPKIEGSIILFKSKCNLKCRHQGKRSTVRLYICVTDLHLLKFSDVGVALQLQVSHLVLMFLMLMESFILLSLVLLSSKLLEIIRKHPQVWTQAWFLGSQSFLTEGLTCLIFSRSCSGVPVPVIRRLFLNIAIRVLASLRWILGSRALSCACLFFISSISRWL